MTKGLVSKSYRKNRKRVHFEYRLDPLPALRGAFPMYYNWYVRNRTRKLPRGWIKAKSGAVGSWFHPLERERREYKKAGHLNVWAHLFSESVLPEDYPKRPVT